ncbi:hypothetical protein P691DRAFT_796436 [Macrolepiota fuliginosa MF-IS2]|uniref:BTB domain-containing protein n=1 Tax=Macrolepiota fuliginosa MF-IS2 TaxID=1400762 RepID=A0A9P6C0M2_9AGAR|nr:hypothetical protein P691DRAFT_796436 [Macrolepiota fuliginosa MF-IS2]
MSKELTTDFVRTDFWFYDGNVVIIAGPAAFKVHRGQLERHSEAFLGLFAVPQPPSQEQDLVDGCPCVEFHDSPSDVFYFLSALYDGLYFKFPRANDFPAIAAVLRLSTKYMVETLRIRCLHRLHLDWPPSLQGWDQREASATDDSGRYSPRDTCPHPILVVQLALEMGIPTILPAALYDLSRYGPSKILAGARKPMVAPSPTSSPNILTLSHPLLCKTLRGREASQRYIAGFLSLELYNRHPAPECLNRYNPVLQQHCTESFYYIMLNILRSVGGIACGRDADPLFTLVQALEMLSRTDFTTADTAGGAGGEGSGAGTGGGDGVAGNAGVGAGADGNGGTGGEGGGGGGRSVLKRCGLRMCAMCKVDFARAVAKARDEVWGLLPAWFELV